MRIKTAFLTAIFASCLMPGALQSARATTMTATLCTINVGAGACPLANTLDFGVRFNGVPLLGANRWAILPYSFQDGIAGISGNIFVVDIAGTWIYLYGQGVANGNNAAIPVFLSVGITQDYVTFIPGGIFLGVDAGFCNGAANAAGSGQTGFAFVNGGAVLPAAGGTACPAFLQTFGPAAFGLNGITNLTAVANFNMGVGGGQLITLPWGADYPDPFAPTLNDLFGLNPANPPVPGSDPSVDQIISTLNSLGLTQQVPEPMTISLFGAGLLFLMRRRAAKV